MKKPKQKQDPPPTLHLGRYIRITLTGQPVPEFIQKMIVKGA